MARIAALVLFASALHAQFVDGTVTDRQTHAGLAGVTVNLHGPSSYSAVTDRAGVFHIGPVEPGKYFLKVDTPGYTMPAGSGKNFAVGATAMTVSLEMDPQGRLQGRVLYPDGKPAPRAPLWLAIYPRGGVLTRTADEKGHFDFEDVKPGAYILRAGPPSGASAVDGEIWAPTYFPNATERGSAETIRLRSGATFTQDIRLRSVPARRIRGLIRDEGGRTAAGVTVTLTAKEPNAGPERTVTTGDDGAFEFPARDGQWIIAASRQDSDAERKGLTVVPVSRHDVENVEVRLTKPFSIPVLLEGTDFGRAGLIGVVLVPVDAPSSGSQMSRKPGQITIDKVYPGRYTILPMGGPAGSYLDSIKLGDADASAGAVGIWDGSLPIRIAYKSGAPRVRGKVDDAGAVSVIVLPQDEAALASGRSSIAKASAEGRYETGGLRPGDYYVLAIDRDPLLLGDPLVMRTLIPRAEKVHLEKGDVATVDLKLTPWPE